MGKQQVLADLIARHRWTVGAELGVYQGHTFFYLLNAFPDLRLIGVDPWSPRSADDPVEDYGVRVRRLAQSLFPQRSKILHRSLKQGAVLIDEPLDFVFINSGHGPKTIQQCIRAWSPKVRVGGALVGCDAGELPVRHVLDRCLSYYQPLSDGCWLSWV